MRPRMNLMRNLTSFRLQGDQPIAIFCQLWISYFSHINLPQRNYLKELLNDFPNLTSDRPGLCHVIQHDMKLISTEIQPIRQPAYRTSPLKKNLMKKEVEFLLNNSLAEPSISSWVLLVC